jgi:hypothetical protein
MASKQRIWKMDNMEPGADNEDFVSPDSSTELIANARARVKALEATVRKQIEQDIDARLSAAKRPSVVQEETNEELAARRKAAKWKAEKWKADAQRRSGFLGLFSESLREVMDHIDALEDEAVRPSLGRHYDRSQRLEAMRAGLEAWSAAIDAATTRYAREVKR